MPSAKGLMRDYQDLSFKNHGIAPDASCLEQPSRPQHEDDEDIEEAEDETSAENQAVMGPGVIRVEVGDLTDDGPWENVTEMRHK
jgi:hypothetical protein